MTEQERKYQREWRKKHPYYSRDYMRRWRANPENRVYEKLKVYRKILIDSQRHGTV